MICVLYFLLNLSDIMLVMDEHNKDIQHIMRRSIIEPLAFITSVDKNGKPNVMTASWNMKVSYKPPMLAIAIQDSKNTHKLILESKEFTVSIPSPELREQIEYFGSVSGVNEDKFAISGIKTQRATNIKPPILSDARINFECKLHSYVKPADHYVFFGEIVAAHLNETKEQLFYTGRSEKDNVRTFDSKPGTKQ